MSGNGKLGFGGDLRIVKHSNPHRVRRIKIPGLGDIAFCKDPGNALVPGAMFFLSRLELVHKSRNGKIIEQRDLGSGLVTIGGVNLLVSDAVTGGIATLANFKWHDSGTGTAAATDGDTGIQTAIAATAPARVSGTLSSTQTATTGNHAAKMLNTATIVYNTSGPTYPIAVTEWGLFSASTAGTMWDRKVFAAVNVNNGDSITFNYTLTISSNT